MKNYILKSEAISHTDLTEPDVKYYHTRKFVNPKNREESYLTSDEITLERYTQLCDQFGGRTAYVY